VKYARSRATVPKCANKILRHPKFSSALRAGNRQYPVAQKIPPESPISITTVGPHETAWPASQQLARQRQILSDKQIISRIEELLQLQFLREVNRDSK
jgi:hypothetical protein